MDPIEEYLKEHKFSIDTIPRPIIIDQLKHYHHFFDDDHVYGIKLVSKKNQDMFEANTYIVGQDYEMEDSSDAPFDSYQDHTAGIWSYGCIKELIMDEIRLNQNSILSKPILVRYQIKDIIPVRRYLKGRKMHVSSEDWSEIQEILMSSFGKC